MSYRYVICISTLEHIYIYILTFDFLIYIYIQPNYSEKNVCVYTPDVQPVHWISTCSMNPDQSLKRRRLSNSKQPQIKNIFIFSFPFSGIRRYWFNVFVFFLFPCWLVVFVCPTHDVLQTSMSTTKSSGAQGVEDLRRNLGLQAF